MHRRTVAPMLRLLLVPVVTGVLAACAATPRPSAPPPSAIASAPPPSASAPPVASAVGSAATRPETSKPRFPSADQVGEIGWFLSGGGRDVYRVSRDSDGMRAAWMLAPDGDTQDKYGTWMRAIDPERYRGKRVRITATLKTEHATERVDFWARAQASDSPGDGAGLSGGSETLPANTTWAETSIVLDVPEATSSLQYGVGVGGPGRVWLESAWVAIVGSDTPLSGAANEVWGKSDLPEWNVWAETSSYAAARDTGVKHAGKASARIESTVPKPRGYGMIQQPIATNLYRGKRVRLRAFVRAEGVTGWAGVWMRVDGPGEKRELLAYDNMKSRPIKGTVDWQEYSVVLDVADLAHSISFGLMLDGVGKVWIDDASLTIVDKSVAVTGQNRLPDHGMNLDFER